jgi:hypothetical protein
VPASSRASRPTSDPSPDAPSRLHRLRDARLTSAALVGALLLGGVLVVQDVRSSDAAAAEAERRSASSELTRDVEALRTELATPARDGQQAATALLRTQLNALAGEDVDPALQDQLIDDLRTAADDLDSAAGAPMPQRPAALPVATADPVFARLDGLADQARSLAEDLRAGADVAAAWKGGLEDLSAATSAYAEASELPASDDPDAVAEAWRSELDRLTTFRDDVEAAAAAEPRPSLEPLADAKLAWIDGMEDVAERAVALLDAGDLDGYTDLLDDELGGDDPFGSTADLEAARERIGQAAVDGPLQTARSRALGLLTELEELRKASPAHLAEAPESS